MQQCLPLLAPPPYLPHLTQSNFPPHHHPPTQKKQALEHPSEKAAAKESALAEAGLWLDVAMVSLGDVGGEGGAKMKDLAKAEEAASKCVFLRLFLRFWGDDGVGLGLGGLVGFGGRELPDPTDLLPHNNTTRQSPLPPLSRVHIPMHAMPCHGINVQTSLGR